MARWWHACCTDPEALPLPALLGTRRTPGILVDPDAPQSPSQNLCRSQSQRYTGSSRNPTAESWETCLGFCTVWVKLMQWLRIVTQSNPWWVLKVLSTSPKLYVFTVTHNCLDVVIIQGCALYTSSVLFEWYMSRTTYMWLARFSHREVINLHKWQLLPYILVGLVVFN